MVRRNVHIAKWLLLPTLPTSDIEVPDSNLARDRISAHDCMALHCTEHFIIILPSTRYDNNVERDVKHLTIIINTVKS